MSHQYTPTFLIRNRFGTFYFRYLIPKKFSGYTDKRIEIRRSLKTNLRSLAVERARRLLVSIEALISDFYMREEKEHPVEWLRKTINQLIKQDELDREKRQQFFENLLTEAVKKLEGPLEVLQFDEPKQLSRKQRTQRVSGLAATRISDAIDKYCLEYRVHWRPKTEDENRFVLNLLARILDDRKIGTLTLEDMRTFKEAVLRIPKNRSKIPKYRNLSAKELLEIDVPMNERMNARNAQKYLSRSKSFLNWARLNGFMTTDIGGVLNYKIPERAIKRRLPYTHTDLRKLIHSDEYKKGLHKKPYHFWIPLLGMFTGARLNEICQLHVTDIRRLSNIWVISIRDGGERRVKNETSIRDVPIHSKLIELGFLTFVSTKKKAGEERLFSELRKHRDGYGGSASKWFCEYQDRCGVKIQDEIKELKSFHSFRHTVSTMLANSTAPGLYERVINQILGHEKGRSESMKTYTHGISVRALKDAVEEIKYHLDFAHLQNPDLNPWLSQG